MIKGDMELNVHAEGKPKTIAIREGELFNLPGRVPHSPQVSSIDSHCLKLLRSCNTTIPMFLHYCSARKTPLV